MKITKKELKEIIKEELVKEGFSRTTDKVENLMDKLGFDIENAETKISSTKRKEWKELETTYNNMLRGISEYINMYNAYVPR